MHKMLVFADFDQDTLNALAAKGSISVCNIETEPERLVADLGTACTSLVDAVRKYKNLADTVATAT